MVDPAECFIQIGYTAWSSTTAHQRTELYTGSHFFLEGCGDRGLLAWRVYEDGVPPCPGVDRTILSNRYISSPSFSNFVAKQYPLLILSLIEEYHAIQIRFGYRRWRFVRQC
jgi:hypothetical protein